MKWNALVTCKYRNYRVAKIDDFYGHDLMGVV